MADDHILTLKCPDRPGIVHAVTAIFAAHGHILDLRQFSDPVSRRFFMRVHFWPAGDPDPAAAPGSGSAPRPGPGTDHLVAPFDALAAAYRTSYDIRPTARRTRVLIMVSKIGHCLNDLLFRVRAGQLRVDVAAVVSNHDDFRALVEGHGVAFHHLPVAPDTKPQQEAAVLDLVRHHRVELVVLARYMQVLSPALCEACPAASSTSTTASCPPSRAPAPTTRPTTAASRSSAPPPTSSPPTSTRAPSSSSASPASTTAWAPASWPSTAPTPPPPPTVFATQI